MFIPTHLVGVAFLRVTSVTCDLLFSQIPPSILKLSPIPNFLSYPAGSSALKTSLSSLSARYLPKREVIPNDRNPSYITRVFPLSWVMRFCSYLSSHSKRKFISKLDITGNLKMRYLKNNRTENSSNRLLNTLT